MHFELIFIRCEEGLEPNCVAYSCPVVSAPHVEKTGLPYLITLSSLSEVNWPYVFMALFLRIFFCSIDLCVRPFAKITSV